MTKSQRKCSGSDSPQLFISIRDFDTEETDDSQILITIIDSMGQPEETKIFDETNYDDEKWIQDGFLTTGAKNICDTLRASDVCIFCRSRS